MTLSITLSNRVIVKKNSRRLFRGANGQQFNLPSVAFEKFKGLSRSEIMPQLLGVTFTKPVRVEYQFFLKGKLDADLDNLIASVNDVLTDCKVWTDDKQVHTIEARKIAGCRAFATEITIHGEL